MESGESTPSPASPGHSPGVRTSRDFGSAVPFRISLSSAQDNHSSEGGQPAQQLRLNVNNWTDDFSSM